VVQRALMRCDAAQLACCDARIEAFALVRPWTLESLGADFNPNALKDTYDHSCFPSTFN
jgi:hypothetical protein